MECVRQVSGVASSTLDELLFNNFTVIAALPPSIA